MRHHNPPKMTTRLHRLSGSDSFSFYKPRRLISGGAESSKNMTDIKELFNRYAILQDTIESIKAEFPQLAEAEKEAEAVKKQIQDFAKANGEASGSGYEVKLSVRGSWDGKSLDGYAVAHPELQAFKSETQVATVKKAK